ncbi:MAG: GatB/YqeY domain-containing protein [Rhodothermales bacterium]
MITERLTDDLKAAMRAGDKTRVRTIRSLRAALTEREIQSRQGGEGSISETEALAVLQKQAKQRRDSIEQFEAAGRQDLVDKEEDELAIIEEYLPRQMSDDELRAVLHEVIAATGAASPRDLGKVMGAAIERTRGLADGKRVSEMARELLSGGQP